MASSSSSSKQASVASVGLCPPSVQADHVPFAQRLNEDVNGLAPPPPPPPPVCAAAPGTPAPSQPPVYPGSLPLASPPPPPPPPPTPAQPVVSPPAFLAQPHRQQQQQQRPPVLGNGIMGSPPPAMSPAELIAAASSGSLPQAALQASLLTALSDITARQQIVNQQLAAKVIHSKQQMIAATLVNLVVQNSQYLQTGLLPPAVLQKLQQQQAAYRQQLRLDGLDSTSPRLPGLSSVSSTSSSGISSADDYLLDSSTQPFSPDGSDSSTSSLMHDAQFSFRPCASDTSTPGDTSLVTPPCRARRNRFHSGPKSPCQTSDHGSSDFSRCSSSHSSRDSRTRARMRTSSEALDHCSPVVSQQSVGMLGSDSENPIEQVHVQQTDLSSTKLPCYSEKHPAHVPPTAQANCAVLPDRSVDHIAQHSEPSAVDPAVAAKHFVPVPEQCPSSSDACAYAKPAMAACKQRGTSATAVLCVEPFVPVSLPLVSASGGRAAVPTAQPSFAQSMPESTVADAAPCAKPEVPHSILPSAALSPPPPPPDTAPVEDKPLDAKPFVPFSTKSVCVSSGVCTTTAVSASKTDKEGSVTQSIESPVVLRSIPATNAGAVRTVPTYDWHRPVPPATSPNPRCTPSVATPEAETCSEGRTANVNNLNEMPSQLDSPRKKCKKDIAASSARPAKPNSIKRSEVGKIANSSSRGEVTDKLRSPKAKQARGSSTTNTSTLKTPPRTYSGNLPKAGKADRASRSGTVCRQQSPNQKHTKEEVTTKATMSNNSSPEMFASAKSTDTVSNRHSSVGTPHIQEPPAAVTARPHTPPRTASTGLAESVTESPPLSQCSAARTRTRPVDPRRSGRLYSDLFAEDSKSETLDAPIPAWANDKAWVQPAEFDFTTIEISSTASTQPERKTAAVHSSQSGVKLNCLEDSSTDDGVVRADAANGVASTDFNARLCGEIDAGSVPMHLQGEKQQHHQQQQQQQQQCSTSDGHSCGGSDTAFSTLSLMSVDLSMETGATVDERAESTPVAEQMNGLGFELSGQNAKEAVKWSPAGPSSSTAQHKCKAELTCNSGNSTQSQSTLAESTPCHSRISSLITSGQSALTTAGSRNVFDLLATGQLRPCNAPSHKHDTSLSSSAQCSDATESTESAVELVVRFSGSHRPSFDVVNQEHSSEARSVVHVDDAGEGAGDDKVDREVAAAMSGATSPASPCSLASTLSSPPLTLSLESDSEESVEMLDPALDVCWSDDDDACTAIATVAPAACASDPERGGACATSVSSSPDIMLALDSLSDLSQCSPVPGLRLRNAQPTPANAAYTSEAVEAMEDVCDALSVSTFLLPIGGEEDDTSPLPMESMQVELSNVNCSVTMSPDSNEPCQGSSDESSEVDSDAPSAHSACPLSRAAAAAAALEDAVTKSVDSVPCHANGQDRPEQHGSQSPAGTSQPGFGDDVGQLGQGRACGTGSSARYPAHGISDAGDKDTVATSSLPASERPMPCTCRLEKEPLPPRGRFKCCAVDAHGDDREVQCTARDGPKSFRYYLNPLTGIWSLICLKHHERLRQHHLCCLCGRFCIEGFSDACNADSSHRFHRKCLNGLGACPHCTADWCPPPVSPPRPAAAATATLLPKYFPVAMKRPLSPEFDRSSSSDSVDGTDRHGMPPPPPLQSHCSPQHKRRKHLMKVQRRKPGRSLSYSGGSSTVGCADMGTITPQEEKPKLSLLECGGGDDSASSGKLSFSSCVSSLAASASSAPPAHSRSLTSLPDLSPRLSLKPKRTSRMSIQSAVTPTDKFIEENTLLASVLASMDTASWSRGVRQSPRQLYQAALRGEMEKCVAALVHDMDANWCNPTCHNRTAVHAAAEGGHSAILLALHKHLGKMDAKDDNGVTPLILAVVNDRISAVELLKGCNVDFNHQDKEGKSCLHHACEQKNLGMIECLMTVRTLDINMPDAGGWTPLMWSAESDTVSIVEQLVKNGAQVDRCDKELNTALHWAAFGGAKHTVSFLVQAGAAINALTVKGDTPLHIAARNDHDDCVIRLLRKADQFIANNSGELPVDLVEPNGEAYLALKVLEASSKPCPPPQRFKPLYIPDISKGREVHAVSCYNDVDGELPPADFVYVAQNVETRIDTSIKRAIMTMDCCRCDSALSACCTSARSCCCVERNPRQMSWYTKDGLIDLDIFKIKEPVLYECNMLCNCRMDCPNRLVQHGTKYQLQLYKTEKMGWGVRTAKRIPRGSFVCEYVGELISDDDAEERGNDSYIFDIGLESSDDMWCVDACRYGNIARFINHSCEPNIKPIRVFAQHQDHRFPHMALFSTDDVESGAQICFDYGANFWKVKGRHFSCECGTPSCSYKRKKR